MRIQLGPSTLGAGAPACVVARLASLPERSLVDDLAAAGAGALLLPASASRATECELARLVEVGRPEEVDLALAARPDGLWVGSLHDATLLDRAAAAALPLCLSAGGATLDEVRRAVLRVQGLGVRRLVVVQRTEPRAGESTSPGDLEVGAVAELRARLGVLTGYDDTSPTVDAAAAAAALGAVLIAKDVATPGDTPAPCAVRLDAFGSVTRAVRSAEAVRGRGSKRVAACESEWRAARGLGSGASLPPLRLRPAEERDLGLVWLWANDATSRLVSLVPGRIPYVDHVAWFRRTLERSDVELWIAESSDAEPLAALRLDEGEDGPAEVSLNVSPDARGAGVGRRALEALIATLRERGPTPTLGAAIDDANVASRRCFESVGFERAGDKVLRGAPVGWYERASSREREHRQS